MPVNDFIKRVQRGDASGLPKGWRIELLDLVANRGTGHTPDRTVSAYRNGGIRWLSLKDSHRLDRLYVSRTTDEVSADGIANSSAVLHPKGVVVLSRDAGIGKSAITRCDMAVSQHFMVWQCKPEISPVYLYWWLQLLKPEFERVANGSTIKTIGVGYFQKLRVVVPPISIQKRVGRLLRAWNRAEQQTARLVKLKRKLRHGLMQQLLTGHHRFPEFAGQPWREVRIGDVLEEQFRPVAWNDNATYRLASVRRNSKGMLWREALMGSQIKVKKLHTIRAGDFLLSHIQAAYGAMAIVSVVFDGGHVSDMYTILAPRDATQFDTRFFGYLAERPEMRHAAYVSSNGFFAERLRLNFDPRDFLRRKIFTPPTVAEQQKIIAVLAAADREIDLLEQQLAALREQKKGLMQKLLTGQVRVKAANQSCSGSLGAEHDK